MKILKKNFWHIFKKILPVLVLSLVVLSFFWKVVLKGEVPLPGDFIVGVYYPWLDYKWGYPAGVPVKNPITTDAVSYTYPMQTFAMGEAVAGRLPLWNPYILTGSPLLANFQSAPFAPTSFLYFMFNKITSWSLQVIFQHLLAAIFTYLLLRHWKISKTGSILGGIIFAFSGYNIIFSQWNGHTLASSFIPLAILFADRLLEKGRFLDGFFISVSLALQFFSGYTQTSLYTAVAIGILWIVKIWGRKDFLLKTFLLKTFILAIFCLLSLGLSGVQILPSLELMQNSQRDFEPHPYEWSFLPWKKTITFIAPDYFGNHSTHNYWGPQDYTSNTGFVGAVAFVLAIIAFKVFKEKREVKFLFILLIVSVLLSFPTPLSIFIWKNDIIGMKANSAHRATVLITVAASLLTGFGFDILNKKLNFKIKSLAIFIPLLILVGFVFYAVSLKGVITSGSIDIFKTASRNLILPIFVLFTTGLVILSPRFKVFLLGLAILELFYFGFKYTPFSPRRFVYPETPVITFLKNQQKPFRTTGAKVIPSNMRMAYGIESLEGYDTFHPLNISRFVSAINNGTSESRPVGRYGIVDNDISHLLDLANTKYYLALKQDKNGKVSPDGQIPNRFDPKRFKVVFEDKSVAVLESKTVLPRAFMVYEWEVEIDGKRVLNKILDEKYPFGKKVILDKEPQIQQSRGSISKVEYLSYEATESVINVETEKDGLLFISDAYYPGWIAYVDKIETPIHKADYNFRAIAIPSGNHKVEFKYQPQSFYRGLKLSLVSLLSIIPLYAVFSTVGRKRS